MQYDLDDDLFTPEGMRAAHDRLTRIFAGAGAPDAYTGQVYPGPHRFDLAMQAVRCVTSEKEQVRYAIETANMPARQAAYDDAELRKQFPADLLELWQQSIDTGGPRPASPYWATIVNATLNKWHPADSVNPESTPQSSADFIRDALQGKVLL